MNIEQAQIEQIKANVAKTKAETRNIDAETLRKKAMTEEINKRNKRK